MLYILVKDHVPRQVTKTEAVKMYRDVLKNVEEDEKDQYAEWVMTESGPGELCLGDRTLFVVEFRCS